MASDFLKLEIDNTHGQNSLRTGGGGPYDSGMEARVANLEQDMREVKADLTDIKITLARLETRFDAVDAKLDAKVGHKWMLGAIFGICALILREEIFALLTG